MIVVVVVFLSLSLSLALISMLFSYNIEWRRKVFICCLQTFLKGRRVAIIIIMILFPFPVGWTRLVFIGRLFSIVYRQTMLASFSFSTTRVDRENNLFLFQSHMNKTKKNYYFLECLFIKLSLPVWLGRCRDKYTYKHIIICCISGTVLLIA